MPINKPTKDFEATTFDVALAQGETGAITAKIGTGLSIPATRSYLQIDYNSTVALGSADAPETIYYATYNSGTGALTGVVRGQAGTTDVAHSAGAEVQCAMSTAFLEDNTGWKTIKGTFSYASATTINVDAGATAIYSVGDKLRFKQTAGTYVYFYVETVANALLTVTGGTDYTVANETITVPDFSKASSPVGFPANSATFSPLGVAYAGIATTQGSITTIADLTNLTITVTVPTGKRIRITGFIPQIKSSVDGDRADLSIREGSTVLQTALNTCSGTVSGFAGFISYEANPTAGAHTYKLSLARGNGSGNLDIYSAATAPAYIKADLI